MSNGSLIQTHLVLEHSAGRASNIGAVFFEKCFIVSIPIMILVTTIVSMQAYIVLISS